MSISEIAIRRRAFAWMLFWGLILFGLISFFRMGVSQLPDVDFPVVSVSFTLEGAAPEVMETDVVDVVEDAMMSVQGIRSVTSSSRNGQATVSIEFDLDRNIDAALQDVQNKIAQVQRRLPSDIDPPVVNKVNPEDQPIIWISLRSDRAPLKELMAYVRDRLKDRFTSVPGVGEVMLGGYVEPNLRVWASAKKLEHYSLTVNDLINAISNEHSELPAGRIETPKQEFNVRTLGEAKSPEEFGNLVINNRGGMPNYAPIYMKQVAETEEGLEDVRRISRVRGLPAVGMGIKKQRGSNAVEVAKAIKQRMAEVQKTLPAGMELNVNFDSTRFIEESVSEITFTLILSAILTSIVCWAFLGSISSTVNILLAIPTSIIGTFIVLYFMGFTLNTFTLLGLSLAIGIVVDDAIMMLENIIRHQEEGENRFQAAIKGSREIAFAAIVATIAIVAIFLPVAFMKGVIGKFFFQFGVTMSVAVGLSLLEALTLTPMRASQYIGKSQKRMKVGRIVDRIFERGRVVYLSSLQFALKNRWKVLGVSLLFALVSCGSMKFLNKEISPPQDQSIFLIRFQTPVGSSLPFTDGKMRLIEEYVKAQPEVKEVFCAIGGMGGGEVNTGIAFITLVPREKRKLSQTQVMDRMRKDLGAIADLKVFLQDLSLRGFSGSSRGFPVEFTVRGRDWDKLAEVSQQMVKDLEKTGLVTDVDTDYQVGMTEVHVIPDRAKAAEHAVSVSAIGQTVNALIGGVRVGKYPKGGHRYDIRLRLTEAERGTAEAIKLLSVRNNRGETIPLSSLVRIEEKPTLQVVSRRDRERAISVFANLKAGQSQSVVLEKVEELGKKLPEGYRVALTGSGQGFKEIGFSLIFALILGICISYMVLASQFNSYIDPITVLMALPFSLSGAAMALLLTGQSLNMYSFIGLILLMGIVKKNSILLVDFTNTVRDRGEKSIHKALLKACPVRLRPIVMTSLATIAGAIPAALALGPGSETRVPMSVAVIGGVLVSTLLTLFVVPVVYSLFSEMPGRGQRQALEDAQAGFKEGPAV